MNGFDVKRFLELSESVSKHLICCKSIPFNDGKAVRNRFTDWSQT